MALILRRSSKWWYAGFRSNRHRKLINLGVVVEGQRPRSVSDTGDDEFERSRGRALAAHDRIAKEVVEDRTGQRTLQNLAEMKTGKKAAFPKLADLAQHWDEIPRRKAPDARYATQCKVTLKRFAEFVAKEQPDATEYVGVKPATAKAFLAAEMERGVSPKTWNDILKLLRATFKHLHPHLNEGSNPFHGLVTKASDTVNREPFTVEELKAILEVCAEDDFIRPIIVTGIHTAMRRGDCCLLKWDDVNLEEGFLRVKTAKTGEMADIPIFPLLAEEIRKARAVSVKSPYCFPAAAEMYNNNPDGITWRVKQVLAKALDLAASGGSKKALSPTEVRERGLAYIDALANKGRAEKMRAVFLTYIDGASLEEVMAKTECSRGTVSNYLNELERELGCTVLRSKKRALTVSDLQVERETGRRRASVHDFHSFRVTWITVALAAGVPLEVVQRVTGHRTTAVVLKHYFRPGRDDFRKALMTAMPQMLSEGAAPSPRDQMRTILEEMTAETWREDRKRLMELVAGI